MKVDTVSFKTLMEGQIQYSTPPYQRPYTWTHENWRTLWEDIIHALEGGRLFRFMGPIIVAQIPRGPQALTQWLIIDGQQRFTTLYLLLIAIRDTLLEHGADDESWHSEAKQVDDLYIRNYHRLGSPPLSRFKILPKSDQLDGTGVDRDAVIALVESLEPQPNRRSRSRVNEQKSGVQQAYTYFRKCLGIIDRQGPNSLDPVGLIRFVLEGLTFSGHFLEERDNPQEIFISINARGQTLRSSDHFRSYFFQKVPPDNHDNIYYAKWQPLEKLVRKASNLADTADGGEVLDQFFGHFIMMLAGTSVKHDDMYATTKRLLDDKDVGGVTTDLERTAKHYEKIVKPSAEDNPIISKHLEGLRPFSEASRIFLLVLYRDYDQGTLTEAEFIKLLGAVESFLVRRFVCGVTDNGLGLLFPALERAASKRQGSYVENVLEELGVRDWPSDEDFVEVLTHAALYTPKQKNTRLRYLLIALERQLQLDAKRKEVPAFTDQTPTIEHIMPQTLTDAWRTSLGPEWQTIHNKQLHTLGNLSLTGINSELSNRSFLEKKAILPKFGFEMNTLNTSVWGSAEIQERGCALAQVALRVWPAPVNRTDRKVGVENPIGLRLYGTSEEVASWPEVFRLVVTSTAKRFPHSLSGLALSLPEIIAGSKAFTQRSCMGKATLLRDSFYYDAQWATKKPGRVVTEKCRQIVQQAGGDPNRDYEIITEKSQRAALASALADVGLE